MALTNVTSIELTENDKGLELWLKTFDKDLNRSTTKAIYRLVLENGRLRFIIMSGEDFPIEFESLRRNE